MLLTDDSVPYPRLYLARALDPYLSVQQMQAFGWLVLEPGGPVFGSWWRASSCWTAKDTAATEDKLIARGYVPRYYHLPQLLHQQLQAFVEAEHATHRRGPLPEIVQAPGGSAWNNGG